MSTGGILGLGAIAGFTIFLGLPVGRMRVSPKTRTLLNAIAIGVLVFLLVDVLEHAVAPVEDGLHNGGAKWVGLAALLTAGFGVGLLSLVYYDRLLPRRPKVTAPAAPSVGGASAGGTSIGPGAAAIEEFASRSRLGLAATPGRQLALMIAIGIGLHNFAEGLAIGQSAAADEISLAVLLVVGFGLHNATEGFGIVGPLAGEAERPSWGLLAVYGLIGGGPTFVGTVIGQSFTNDAVSVLFLALAAGSILYVVVQLVGVALRAGFKEMLYWGVFLGVVAGFATDFIIQAAGA